MRITNIIDAGIFTIAFASANLLQTIGKYGIRNYQVTDYSRQFNFGAYVGSRILTCSVMLFTGLGYSVYMLAFANYTIAKAVIVFLMCLFKTADCVEDVFHGLFQQEGRLDAAGRAMTIRLALCIVFFIIALALTKSLLIATLTATILAWILLYAFTYSLVPHFGKYRCSFIWKEQKKLLLECLSLFLCAFLSAYIINAPRYAIDAHLTEELQAYYGFISMPIFVISLLNEFIYKPLLKQMSEDWSNREFRRFSKTIVRQALIIAVITCVCIGGAYTIGAPVLSILYNADLFPYKLDLVILLAGGGMLAYTGLFSSVITTIRFQNSLTAAYLLTAVMAFFLSPLLVLKHSLRGASIGYFSLTALLAILLFVLMLYKIKKVENKNGML
jgi:O-antigen/teichoic acid export membrane protein